jgi:lycopene epsilon-cyclase
MRLGAGVQRRAGAVGTPSPPRSAPAPLARASRARRPRAALADAPPAPPAPPAPAPAPDTEQGRREGAFEAPLVRLQAAKPDPEQPPVASALGPLDAAATADVAVVGCGPAGLSLAAELARRGLTVALLGLDGPFVNNYGVWVDEFEPLGLESTLDHVWTDAVCHFREGGPGVRVGRAYGRVCRRRLRAELLARCAAAGVRFLAAEVTGVDASAAAAGGDTLLARAGGGAPLRARLAVLASGAAAGRFLRYERGAPGVAAQTAYGVEAEAPGYSAAYDAASMLFMDYRRHHSGLAPGTAGRVRAGEHPNGGEGLWGAEGEAPSFLYAMPLGGDRVFLEETCLVARPPLPFAVLKRRLERRCAALGIVLKEVHEEEWSFIPTGGPLPAPDQPILAFGAAAGLVHPATGYSIARSLAEAPAAAEAIARALASAPTPAAAAAEVWAALWSPERRRQAAFNVFGMELLCALDLGATADFFTTFFALPAGLWRGFLASGLGSLQLLGFALATFALAPLSIKAKLVSHLATDPSGKYMIERYLRADSAAAGGGESGSGGGGDGGAEAGDSGLPA